MSAYKYFFIKSNTNEFIPIGEFSRNTEVYRDCNAPYRKIKPLTIDNLNQIICDIEQGIECVKRGIQADKDVRDVLTEYIGSNDSYISWHVKEREYYDEYAKSELIAINNGLIALGCNPGEEVLIAI